MNPATSAPVVDIALPVYNEAKVLESSVERLHRYLSDGFPFTWRITIVDNASTDGTLEIAEKLADRLPCVSVLHLDSKGRGLALRAAWTSSDAEIVAYMDIDLSTGLDSLLPLIAPLVNGHSDLAIGSRLAPGASVARGPRREIISRSYNLILRVVFANRFRDAQCGFKAARAEVARRLLPEVHDNGWFFDTELLLVAEHNGLRVFEVPVDWVDDPDTRVQVAHTAREDLRGVARVARSFVHGEGKVDLGPFHRAPISDDMGRQFVSFAAVGTVSTAVSLLIFLILQREIHPLWANVGALAGTSIANAWANRRFTFGHRSRVDRGRHYLGAAVMLVTALMVSSSLLALVLWRDGGLIAQCLALAASSVVTAIGRFALLRSWVFRDAPPQVSGDTVVTRS
ncbi:MAG TPA: bifunctional glycosyltransferase family 2/GtrA family protein [Ilumatobacteraceae bacterium]|nr:bifunctional glycosyltransferase family 2/GtrA family protein [Ilumatobacteraceae bacterium]